MIRAERKEFLRKLAGRMPRIFGGAGCTCPSCKVTNRYRLKGFAAWPKGAPAGRKSAAAYASHVGLSKFGARVGMVVGPAGAGFYGTPAGSTKAEVDRVLREAFATTMTWADDEPVAQPQAVEIPTPINRKASLLQLSRTLREQAREERRAA